MTEATRDLRQKLAKEAPSDSAETDIAERSRASRQETSEYTRWVYRAPVIPEKISVFGMHYSIHNSGSHNAVDFYVPEGTEVRAPAEGTIVGIVEKSDYKGEDADFQKKSNGILVKTPWQEFVWLGNLERDFASKLGLKRGKRIAAGDMVGKVGHESHVHMEVLKFIGDAGSKNSPQNYATNKISFCWEIPFDVYVESRRR